MSQSEASSYGDSWKKGALQLSRDDIDNVSFELLLGKGKEYSASLTDRRVVLMITGWLMDYLPLTYDEVRWLVLLAFRNYHAEGNVPLQKLALLEPEERNEVFNSMKESISPVFEQIFLPKVEIARSIMRDALDDFFSRYLY